MNRCKKVTARSTGYPSTADREPDDACGASSARGDRPEVNGILIVSRESPETPLGMTFSTLAERSEAGADAGVHGYRRTTF